MKRSGRSFAGYASGVAIIIAWLSMPGAVPRLSAQGYLVHTYNENDGLASSQVYDSVQDFDGRMWFATRSGITCYDGSSWHSFTMADGLPANNFFLIGIDDRGTVWAFSHHPRVVLCAYRDGRWETGPALTGVSQPVHATGWAILSGAAEPRIAVGTTRNGLLIMDRGKWRRLTGRDGLPGGPVYSVAVMTDRFLAATDDGLRVVSEKGIEPFPFPLAGLPSREIRGLAVEEREGIETIWLMGRSWLGMIHSRIFDIQADGLRTITTGDNPSLLLKPDGEGGVYFGNIYDIRYFHAPSRRIRRFGRESGLITEGVTSFLIDRENNLWITSLRGVSKLPGRSFANYQQKQGLLENEVTAIAETSPGRIVFGHNRGLTILEGGVMRHIVLSSDPDLNDLESRVQDLCVDKRGNLWIAASNMGLGRMSPEGRMRWYREGEGLQRPVNSVIADPDDGVWASDPRGLHRLRGGRFVPAPGGAGKLTAIRILHPREGGGVFIATTNKGFYRLMNDELEHFSPPDHDGAKSIYAVTVGPEGYIWVGAQSGLYRIRDGIQERFSNAGRTISRPVYLILKGPDGRLWFGIDNGVMSWDGHRIRRFTIRQGFVGQETNRAAGLVDAWGRLWFGSDLGASMYQAEFDYSSDSLPPPVIRLLGLEASGKFYSCSEDVDLSSEARNLIFRFRAVSFIDESAVRYRCRLEGFDEDWLDEFASPEGRIRYTSVPPGRYRFHIQAKNALGRWSRILQSSEIVLHAPFWKRWWFIAGLLGLGMFVMLSVQNYRTEKRNASRLEGEVRSRTAQLRTSLREKDVMLREIHHRVKNNMQIVSSLLHLQSGAIDDPTLREMYRIGQDRIQSMALIHEQLYQSQSLSRIDFAPYVEKLSHHLISMSRRMDTLIRISSDVQGIFLNINQAIPCGLIINELVTNALKHAFPEGSRGHVHIEMRKNSAGDNFLSISDDGVGLPDGFDIRGNRTLGMQLVRDLVRQLGGTLRIENSGGTRFSIRFPA